MRALPLLLVVSVAACGGGQPRPMPEPAPLPAPEPVATPGRTPEAPVAPDSPAQPPAPEPPPPPPPDPAPWSAAPTAAVPKIFRAEWRKAKNRGTCALLVPTELGAGAGATPRKANFYGGWAVAFDKKGLPGTLPSGEDCATCGRGVFGIAGAGVSKDLTGPDWPNHVRWADGSHADYGPEAGDAHTLLANLAVADQGCLYNVWTSLGEDHLLTLLRGLRKAGP